jgi:FkbM family methyltransferase
MNEAASQSSSRTYLARLGRMIPSDRAFTILRGPLRGCRWITGAAAGWAKGASIYFNNAEHEQLVAVARQTSPEDVAFDLGANVGLYSLLFAQKGARVVAFEPVPRNVGYLQRTLALNRCARVDIVPFAVGDSSGLMRFSTDGNVAVGHLDDQGHGLAYQISLDDYCAFTGIYPTIIKMDVEGSEQRVLRGADAVLQRKPKWFISFHSKALRERSISLMSEYGYRAVSLSGRARGSEYFFE